MRKVLILFAALMLILPTAASAQFRDELPAGEPAAGARYCAAFVVGEKRYWRAECGAYPGEHTMDVAPFIENGRTFVPVRYLAYALGLKDENIGWDGASKRVTLEWPHYTCVLEMQVGNKVLIKHESYGSEQVPMDVAPVLRSGRVYLPARYVAESFGYQVQWDQATKTVRIAPSLMLAEPQSNGTQKPPPVPVKDGGGIDVSKL
ncbi:MAG: copper amine oxidase N-terminal domain-containing protein [Desulfotomaculales bacterium]